MAWIEPTQYWASRPAEHLAAGGLITGPGGKVLLVKPNYAPHWSFPGGGLDEGETPDRAAVREIREETGLTVAAGTLLVVDWEAPAGVRTRAMVHFLFDAGTVDGLDGIVRQEEEIDEVGLFGVAEAITRMSPDGARQLQAALRARETGATVLGWRQE
jgi:8-oxo-dGTP pyrophosphatase MutT (NUDIX family)